MATLAISTSAKASVDVSIAAFGRPYRLPSTLHHPTSTIQPPPTGTAAGARSGPPCWGG